MVIYDMHCGNCGYEGEYFFKNADKAKTEKCPQCESLLEKNAGQLFNINGSSKGHSQQSYTPKPQEKLIGLVGFVGFNDDGEGRAIIVHGNEIYDMPITSPDKMKEKIEKVNRSAMNSTSQN